MTKPNQRMVNIIEIDTTKTGGIKEFDISFMESRREIYWTRTEHSIPVDLILHWMMHEDTEFEKESVKHEVIIGRT